MNAENVRRCLSASFLTLPAAVVVRDNLFSVFRVRGPSMEPSLQDGDIVLVRKSDVFANGKNVSRRKSDSHEGNSDSADNPDYTVAEHSRQMDHIDIMYGRGNSSFVTFARPNPLPGCVIVFSSPTDFPVKHCIKRVLAQEGQRCRPANKPRSIKTVPENSVWVEGDNQNDSEDSCSYGPISKKLIVGQAERIIWPPARFGLVKRLEPPCGRAWW